VLGAAAAAGLRGARPTTIKAPRSLSRNRTRADYCSSASLAVATKPSVAPWVTTLGGTFTLPAAPPTGTLDDAKRTEIATRIWRESRPAAGTLVDVYLRSRGITVSPPVSLRFHPKLKHPSGASLPAMVAAVLDRDGRIVAVHRTFLAPNGSRKAEVTPNKLMLGPCAGGAVRFAKPAMVLAVAEGIETALSVAQACPNLAVWSTLSTSGLKTLQLPHEVLEVVICADADVAGEKAAFAAAERFSRQGRRVRIARPTGTNDFNDMLRGCGLT
jgi:putative DNA primase/helicase